VLLRRHQSFVWNATNLSRRVRGQCIELFAAYGARVRIVAVESSPEDIRHRNGERARPVPDHVIHRMLSIWEAPDLTEAHEVLFIESGNSSDAAEPYR